MKEKTTSPEKLERLKQYLSMMEYYQCQLLDMLRAKDISQQEYNELIEHSQDWYRKFLEDIHKQVDPNQLELDF